MVLGKDIFIIIFAVELLFGVQNIQIASDPLYLYDIL